MDAEQLSFLLWHVDPMGTCCNVNEDMEDEYGSQARDIGERLAAGEDPRSAVVAVFDDGSGKAACSKHHGWKRWRKFWPH